MLAKVTSCAVIGLDGQLVDVEVDLGRRTFARRRGAAYERRAFHSDVGARTRHQNFIHPI